MSRTRNLIEIAIKIIIITLLLLLLFNPKSNALTIDDIIQESEDFLYDGAVEYKNENAITYNKLALKEETKSLYRLLQVIGIAMSVVIGAVMGIQFITGSVEEQAKVKEKLIPYVLGCLIVFGAFNIWKIAINIGETIIDDPEHSVPYQSVMAVTDEQISTMTMSELISYWDKLQEALTEEEKIEKLAGAAYNKKNKDAINNKKTKVTARVSRIGEASQTKLVSISKLNRK